MFTNSCCPSIWSNDLIANKWPHRQQKTELFFILQLTLTSLPGNSNDSSLARNPLWSTSSTQLRGAQAERAVAGEARKLPEILNIGVIHKIAKEIYQPKLVVVIAAINTVFFLESIECVKHILNFSHLQIAINVECYERTRLVSSQWAQT